jgi:hypothetical protein
MNFSSPEPFAVDTVEYVLTVLYFRLILSSIQGASIGENVSRRG